jgi:type I restriction enzyme S subunit
MNSTDIRNANLSDLYKFQYGSGNTIEDIGGDYPIYGSNGIVGFTNKYNSENAPVLGHIGAYAGIVNWAPGKHYVTYNGVICKIRAGIDSKFGYYSLLVSNLQKRLRGSTQPFVSYDLLNEVRVFLPEKDIQQRIGKVLSDLDSKIEVNNKINTELEAMAKTLYDYWFVQFDFPDENGKPYKSSGGNMVYNEELKREIPEGWGVGRFEDVLKDIECGNRPEGGIKEISEGIPSIGAENILSIGKYDYSKEKLIPKEYFTAMKQGVIRSGDVLMYKDGASLGRVSMFKKEFPYKECCINSHAYILRSNHKVTQNYLYLWLDQDFLKQRIIRAGMRAAQPGINQQDVFRLPILIPDKSIVIRFESHIANSIDKIFINAKQNRELAKQRDFLLPMLMNGQITFKSGN